MKKVTKAVIPAAGFGTRFLPWTKAMPKEMLPIVDKPAIQIIIEELVEAGIRDIIIVTGYHKRGIEDHFDEPHEDLIKELERGGEKKAHLLEEVKGISKMANFYFARQRKIRGNFIPLIDVKALLGDEPFIYSWADDFWYTNGHKSSVVQAIGVYEKYGCSVLPCVSAKEPNDYNLYAFIGGKPESDGVVKVNKIVEKPGERGSLTNLAAVGFQLYTPDVFSAIATALKNVDIQKEEFGYYHVLTQMLKTGSKVSAFEVKNGDYLDTGDKLKFLKTQLYFGIRDKKIGAEFKQYLKDFTASLN